VLLLSALVLAVPAAADVTGTPQSAYQSFRVFGQSRSIGNTLMRNLPSEPLVNAVLLTESQARLGGVPAGAAIEGAFLFWSGSVDPNVGTDNTATLRLPNGVTRPVRAERCFNARNNFGGGLFADFFYCRADVTADVSGFAGGGTANGLYTVGGITAMPGLLAPGGGCLEPTCQAMYGGWSLVVVYEAETERTLRDVVIYDGFQLYDETPTAAGIASFNISGFDIANPPEATIRMFGLEGDALLGVPPQDSDPVLRCTTCFDYMSVNGTKLSDPLNPANNLFNSTLPEGSAIGIDIDSFDISSIVRAGDTQIRIEVGSGDGNPATGQNNGAGGGELFGLGYTVVTVNRLAPNFRGPNTFLTADPTEVSPGETIFYTLQVTNEGSLSASDVIARLALPPGTEYVPGSTRVDGTLIPDNGTTAPWIAGLDLGTIPNTGDTDRRVTFRLRVLPTTPGGTLIRLSADITADELTETTTTNEAVVRVIAPTLLTPQKTFTDVNGGNVEPGDIITYNIAIRKDSETSAAGITFIDDIPAFVRLRSVDAGSFTDQSVLNGGANGTGLVRITNITAPRGSTQVTVRFTVQVLSVAELIAAGVEPSSIDGLVVSNQGEVQASFLPAALLTDDPRTGTTPDPTIFRLTSSINFDNADTFKRIADDNGGQLEPGDELTYTISVRNAGNSAATVDISDDFPAGLEGARLLTPVAGFTLTPAPAGANRAGRLEAFGLTVGPRTTIVVRVRGTVAAGVAGGQSFRNTARLDVIEAPAQSRDLVTEDLRVVAGPSFEVTKVAAGATGGFQPGDTVTWTVSVANTGNQPATAVRVSDVVDSRLTAIVPANGGTYNAGTRTITWTIPRIEVGASASVSFTSTISATVPDGSVIPNQASVTGTGVAGTTLSDDPTTPADSDATVIRIDALPELQFTKTVLVIDGGDPTPGNRLRYTLTLRNAGRAAATNVLVVDPLDGSLADVVAANGGVVASGAIRWDSTTTPALGTIAPAGSVTLTFEATIADGTPNGAIIANQGALSSNGIDVLSDDPSVAGVADETLVVVVAEPELTPFTKLAVDENGGSPQPGDVITYQISVTNSGSGPAFDVIINDVVPAGLTSIAVVDGVFLPADRRVIWTLPNVIGAGETVVVGFTAEIEAGLANGTRIENQASVVAAELAAVRSDDPTTAAADDPTVLIVESRPDFALSEKAVVNASGSAEFLPGDEVVYTIEVINSGTETATNITVVDAIDPSLTGAAAGQGGTVTGTTARWTIPSLAPGASTQLTLSATLAFPLADGTLVSNQAVIQVPGLEDTLTDDPATPDVDDPTVFVVTSRPDLLVSKTFTDVNGGSPAPGDTIIYTITVENAGSESATNVQLADAADSNFTSFTFGGVEVGPVAQLNSGLVPEFAELQPGEQVVIEFEAVLASAIPNATVVSNQAALTADNLPIQVLSDDPTAAGEEDPTEFQVISSFDFGQSTKTVSPDADGYRPGDEVEYTVTIVNTGTDRAQNTVVTDALPAGLTFISSVPPARRQGANLVWDATVAPALAGVDVGASASFTIRARINDGQRNGTIILNQASVQATGGAAPFLTDDPATPAVDDPTGFTVLAEPGLDGSTKTVIDSDGDGFFEPGDTVEYVISVIAGGDGPSLNVQVTDAVDITSLEAIEVLNGGRFAGSTITWDASGTPALAEVAPAGTPVELRFRARVRADLADQAIVSNQAFVSAQDLAPVPTDDPATATADDPTNFVVSNAGRLGDRSKTVVDINGGNLEPGDQVQYLITLSNDGIQTLAAGVITDQVPQALRDVVVGPGGSLSGDVVTWQVPALAAGESTSVSFLAFVRDDVEPGTLVSNQATITLEDGQVLVTDDPAVDGTDDPTVVVVGASPDFSTSTLEVFAPDDTFVQPGDRLEYRLRVVNTGIGSGVGVTVVVQYDPGLLIDLEVPEGVLVADGLIQFDIIGIAPGESVEFTFAGTIVDGLPNGTTISVQGRVTNSDGISSPTDDPTTEEVDDPTSVTLNFPGLVESTKTVTDLNGGDVQPGDTLEYLIEFGAGDAGSATNVTVLDPVAEALEIVSVDDGVFDASTRTITWSRDTLGLLAALEPGQRIALRFLARVNIDTPVGTIISNQAIVGSDELPEGALTDDPSTPEVDDSTDVVVGGSETVGFVGAEKLVTDVNGGFVLPGDQLDWSIASSYASPTPAANAVLTDLIGPLHTLVEGSVAINGEPAATTADELATGLLLGDIEPGGVVQITFSTIVSLDAPNGARIENQGFFAADDVAVVGTDNPTTEPVGDPTFVVVGESSDLTLTSKSVELLIDNGDGIPSVGDEFLYRISIPNTGTADVVDAVLTDVLDDRAQFIAGSLTLGGAPLSDAADGDSGEVVGQSLTVRIGAIGVGSIARVEFRVRAVDGPLLINQGTVAWDGRTELTDDDGNPANGNGPTILPLGDAELPLLGSKTVADINGGVVQAGDELLYTIQLRSLTGIEPTIVVDQADDGIEILEIVAIDPDVTATIRSATTVELQLSGIEVDGSRTVVLRARIADGAEDGTLLCNTLLGDFADEVEPACVTVGGAAGVATWSGVVFRERGASSNKDFDAAIDQPLADFLVRVLAVDAPGSAPVAEVVTDASGEFTLPPLAPAPYLVQVFAQRGPDFGGALFLEQTEVAISGESRTLELEVVPAGVIYTTETFAPVGGVRAELWYGAGDIAESTRVPAELLADASQQGQLVPSNGLYRFDAPEGRIYEVRVDTAGLALQFPSVSQPPLQTPAVLEGEAVEVSEVVDPAEELADALQYVLTWNQVDEETQLKNNHIPLDPFTATIVLTKRSDRVSAWVGDIVTYTITLSNQSGVDVVYRPETGRGGSFLADAIPNTFRYVDGSAAGWVRGSQGEERRVTIGARGTLLVEFGETTPDGTLVPLSIPAQSELEIRYQLVVGSSTEPGTRATNRAQLRAADGGILLSNADSVSVRIDYDPVFDQGTIIGKVYCDENGDGRQNQGERPLSSGRIYLDVGYYTDVDEAGQYHFVDIDPGLHLIKIDADTLPPGSVLTTDERRLINITRGMPAMVDFGVTCVDNLVNDVEVLPGDDALVTAAQLRQRRYVEIDGSLADGSLRVDGSEITFIQAAMTAASGTQAVPPTPVLMSAPSAMMSEGPALSSPAVAPATPATAAIGAATSDAPVEGSAESSTPSVEPSPVTMTEGAGRPLSMTPPVRLNVVLDPDGYLVDPIQFAFAVTEGADRWVVEVRTVQDNLIAWQSAGDGAPPTRLTWDGTVDGSGSVLAPSTVYVAQLRVFKGDTLYAASAPVLLEVAGTRVRRLVDERFSGTALDERGRPSDDLQTWVTATRRLIDRQPASLPIRVETHVDDSGDAAADLAATENELAQVIGLLQSAGIDRDRVEGFARGSTRPLYPNIGQRTRQTNRRIEIHINDPELEQLPAEPPSRELASAGLFANERQLDVNPDGSFALGVPRTDDGLVAFQLRLGDRSEVAALVAVRSLEEVPRYASSLLPEVPVEVDLQAAQVSVGGSVYSLDGLQMRLTAENQVGTLNRNRLDSPFDMQASGVPAEVEAWRVEVFGPFGTRIWDQGGSGSVEGRLRWNGETGDGEPIDSGCYDARLTVRTVTGGLVTTAPLALCVQTEGQTVEVAAAAPAPDRVLLAGQPLQATDARYVGSTRRVTGQSVVLDVTHQGVRQLVSFTVPEGFAAQLTTTVDVLPQNLSIDLAGTTPVAEGSADEAAPEPRERGRSRSRSRDERPATEEPAPEQSPEQDPEPEPEPAPEQPSAPEPADDLFRPISGISPDISPEATQPWLALRPGQAPSFMQLELNQALPPAAAEPALPSYEELENWYADEVDYALSTDEGDELARLLAESEAGQISVQLPPQGFRLQSSSLSVYGTTHPNNQVFINGEPAYVFEGEFSHVVELPSGTSEIIVETLDTAGNRGRIVWPVEVASFRYFVMALGDSAIGTRDSDIAGSHDHNSTTVANGNVMLYGQARAYFKGWLSGEEILNGYFDDIEMTAHVDTGRRNEYEPFLRETIQPDRHYPIFGDSSEQVNDVNSRGKVYVLLEADESSLTLGNYRTDIQGVELMRYDRNLYGGRVEFDDVIAEDYRTEVQAFVAQEDYQGARTFNYLQGTGGSIYYLQNRPVIEGSEQVFLIVRDRVSGQELARIPQARNTDYNVRYSEGRLVMRRPIPSVVDDSTMLGGYSTSRTLLAGNPVFIEVAYDYESIGGTQQDSYGVFGRETFHNIFSVGGGVVEENRPDRRDYRLWSVESGVGHTSTSRIDFEYARSVSDDLNYGFSQDGGLTFQQFRADNPRDDEGDALYLRGQFELADVIESDRSRILYFDTYYNRQDRGFFSNGNVLDQGEEKFGGLARWFVNDNHAFSVRHDSTLSTLDNLFSEDTIEDTIELTRRVNTAQYEWAYDPVTFTLAYQNTYTEDYRRPAAFQNDIIGAALYYQILRGLRFGVEQEIVARGEDPRIIRGAESNETTRVEDRFITGVSVAADIGAGIELQATQRFRYSGENSTQIGMRAEIDEESDIYVQQRLTSFRDNHGTASTTVVGGEQRYGSENLPGRSYGEYHMDTGVSGERSRSVMGFGQAWRPVRGLSFSAGYERSQTLAADGGDTDSSRDTVSVGSEFLRLRNVKVSTLLEARFDRGSLIAPSVGSCLANDVSGNPLYCRDRVTAIGDRTQFVTMTSGEWKFDRDYTFFGRFDYVVTENETLDVLEARDMEGTFGLAYRPLFINWLNVLGRYTYLEQLAPYQLDTNLSRHDQSHVMSISPILELPWNLQLVEKVAYRNIRLRTEGLPLATNDLVLWINRLNYHLTRQFDIGAEYRFLHQSLTQDWLHGVLVEFNWIIEDHVRLGIGYNFTRFAEDELGDFDRDSSGVFFRVTAQY
jgi:uncharacterized repeat protein (TIGR01451 family)